MILIIISFLIKNFFTNITYILHDINSQVFIIFSSFQYDNKVKKIDLKILNKMFQLLYCSKIVDAVLSIIINASSLSSSILMTFARMNL